MANYCRAGIKSLRGTGPFRIFSKIRGDIRKSRCTIGINNTGGKFCRRCQWHRWQIMGTISGCWDLKVTLSCEYLRDFTKKIETALMVYSGAWGKLIHENQKSKISWHCPFERFSSLESSIALQHVLLCISFLVYCPEHVTLKGSYLSACSTTKDPCFAVRSRIQGPHVDAHSTTIRHGPHQTLHWQVITIANVSKWQVLTLLQEVLTGPLPCCAYSNMTYIYLPARWTTPDRPSICCT